MSAKTKQVERPKRVKLTLSMTEADRHLLEDMANANGVSMAGLVHQWIQREAKKARQKHGR